MPSIAHDGFDFDAIPQALKDETRWVVWRYEERDGKQTKVPYQARRPQARADATKAATWGTFAQATAAYSHTDSVDGIGFVLGDGWAGVDLDDCLVNEETWQGEGGEELLLYVFEEWAERWIYPFDTYAEISPSGSGVKIFLRAASLHDGAKGHKRGNVEAYTRDRFFTVTGWTIGLSERVEERQDALTAFSAHFFGTPTQPEHKAPKREPSVTLTLDDQTLLEKARAAKNGSKFEALWRGDDSAYDGDESRGDQAFCNLLAFWTQDPNQIDRIVRQSARYREKWDDKRGAMTYGQQTVVKALRSTTERYSPPAPGSPVGGGTDREDEEEEELDGDSRDTGTPGKAGRGPSIAVQLVALAEEAEFFHDEEHEAWVTFPVGGHKETTRVNSGLFMDWLEHRLHCATGRTANAAAKQEALGVFRGKAKFSGPQARVYVRLAEHAGAIYLDLCDEERRAVKVTVDGWEVVSDSPVRFWRPKGMLALPVPVRGGSIVDLRRFVNVLDEEWPLLVGFLVGCYRAAEVGGHPVLAIGGEQGSAKSTLARIIRLQVDPNRAPLRAEPSDKRDLMIAAQNSRLLVYDNLSNLQKWLSDSLCRISTGGGHATRQLYADAEEQIFESTRPIVLTSIGGVASNSDLVDRAVFLSLPRITEEKRRTESDFWPAFERARPGVLGALLDAVATALRRVPTTTLDNLPRMADFARWVVAAEPSLPWEEPGKFLAAYHANRAEAHTLALDASLVAQALLALIPEGQEWEGTSKELLSALTKADPQSEKKPGWPTSPRSLSDAIKTIAPNLRAAGFTVPDTPRRASRGNVWKLSRAPSEKKPAPPPSPPQVPEEPKTSARTPVDMAVDDGAASSISTPSSTPTSPEIIGDDGVGGGDGDVISLFSNERDGHGNLTCPHCGERAEVGRDGDGQMRCLSCREVLA